MNQIPADFKEFLKLLNENNRRNSIYDASRKYIIRENKSITAAENC